MMHQTIWLKLLIISGLIANLHSWKINTEKVNIFYSPPITRKESCNAIQFNQTIFQEGCIPKVIENNYCAGNCNSVTIPSIDGTKQEKCRNCWFDEYEYREVTILCPDRKKQFRKQKQYIVKSCKCRLMESCSVKNEEHL